MLKKIGSALFKAIIGPGNANSPVAGSKLTVKLEDLSPIWLKFNSEFQPHPDKPEKTNEELAIEIAETNNTTQKIGDKTEVEIKTENITEIDKTEKAEKKEDEKEIKNKELQDKKTTSRPLFQSSVFFDEIIQPNKNVLEKMGVYEPVIKMVEYLDKYGTCSSVVGGGFDEEAQELDSLFYILGKITLKDHSFLVTKIALKLLKEEQRDYQNLIPKTIVAALGHDFGKIPELRQNPAYIKADHPIISAEKVKEFFEGKEIFWLPAVLDTIKDHHRQSKDQFTIMIKSADSRARELEISQSNQGKVKKWEEWFDVKRFLELVRPRINVTQGAKWEAFSFESVVYCTPECVYSAARKLMNEKSIIDMSLMVIANKEMVLKNISNVLRRENMLLDTVQENYYGAWYEIIFHQKNITNRKMHLIPIKIETFGSPSDVATMKNGTLSQIKNVVLANFSKGSR